MRAFTREVMAQMGREVNQSRVWMSAAHYNTQHPHVHTILRGRDNAGRPVVIDQDYLYGG